MTTDERKDLGLPAYEDITRFEAFVVDGTASGTFGNLPKFERNTTLLSCSNVLQSQQGLRTTPSHVKA